MVTYSVHKMFIIKTHKGLKQTEKSHVKLNICLLDFRNLTEGGGRRGKQERRIREGLYNIRVYPGVSNSNLLHLLLQPSH